MATLLITGAAGYLGSRVAAAAQAQGIDWAPVPGRLQALAPHSLQAQSLIHCAGRLRAQGMQVWDDNAVATAALARALRPGVHGVFVSSRSVYPLVPEGQALPSVRENHPVAPWDDYGASKAAAEASLQQSGQPWTICRVPTLFGHPERHGCFLDRAADLALRQGQLALAQPERDEDALDVEALAAALLLLALGPAPAPDCRIWHIAGPRRPLRGVLNAVLDSLGPSKARPALIDTPMPTPRTPLLDAAAFRAAFPQWTVRPDAQIFAERRRLAGLADLT